jgi:hypothetical protein
MFVNVIPLVRRRALASVISLASFAVSIGAAASEMPQVSAVNPASAQERLHASSGRETDRQIAQSRPNQREVAARVREERSTWSYEQWDAYGRSMRR